MKTRFCPSPTGYLHLGNLRTALFSYWWSRASAGRWLLRIEDTDRQRSGDAYVQGLVDDLRWLGLHWDEGIEIGGDAGPYYQSQRDLIYQRHCRQLLEQGHAYRCFCSPEQLEADRQAQRRQGVAPHYVGRCRAQPREEAEARLQAGESASLRFRVDHERAWTFQDAVRGEQSVHGSNIGDFVIMRSDGGVGFLLSNAIDDALMGVTHVIRGEDHLSNTPRQMMLLEACALPIPQYAHLALVVEMQGQPLSKRSGSYGLKAMREKGYLSAAVLNTLFRLGHACSEDGLLSQEQMCQTFDISSVGKSASKLDPAALYHWQQLAVRQLDADAFWSWAGDGVLPASCVAYQEQLMVLLKEVVTLPEQVTGYVQAWCGPECVYEDDAITRLVETGEEPLVAMQAACSETETEDVLKHIQQASGLRGKAFFQTIRAVLTGCLHGPSLSDIMAIQHELGLLESRFQQALALLRV